MASMAKPFKTVAIATLASRVMGLVRDLLMAAYFGAGRVADIFFIAFVVPNFFRRLVAEGALSVSFVPVYTESLIKNGKDKSSGLASDILVIQTLAVTLIASLCAVSAPQLMSVFSSGGMTPELFGLAVSLARLMAPYIILASLVSFAMGYLNSHGVFFAPAFATALLNIGMITGIVFLGRFFEQPVYGAALGVLLGGMFQVFFQLPYMVRRGFRFRVSFNFRHPDLVRVFSTMIPAVFGIAAFQINALTGNFLAAMIEEGSVAYIYYTNRLTELVFGVFIVSIGNVILPEMSRVRALAEKKGVRAPDPANGSIGVRASSGDIQDMSRIISRAVSAAQFIAIPAAVGLITAGLPIVSVIFMRGNFSYADSVMTFISFYRSESYAWLCSDEYGTQACRNYNGGKH